MTKRFAKKLIRRLGFDLRRLKFANTEEEVLRKLLALIEPVAVLDVGANAGQYALLLRDVGFRGLIVSFEPIADVHAQLLEITRADPDWVVAPRAALGSRNAQMDINISANSLSSSLLPMRDAHLLAEPDSVYVRRERVEVRRLDELAANLVPDRGALFLKMDTQGFERDVLDGAAGLLDRVTGIQIELSLVPLYEGAPGFIDMIEHLAGFRFELFGIVPGFKDPRTGRLLQVDGYFTRVRSA